MTYHAGRHFVQIPGPTNVPERVLRAIARPTIDHRGPEFARLTRDILARLAPVFGTRQPIVLFGSSGTGAWEAALVNTLSPGDGVLMFETGQFAVLWRDMALRHGLKVDFVPGDWRSGVDPAIVEERLRADPGHAIKAVAMVHNETATGVASPVAAVRAAIDRVGHPALLMVDAISSLGAVEYRHDEWGVDVTIAGSQKGLMLPPGLGFNAVSGKALEAAKSATLPRSYLDWGAILAANADGSFPYTPATNLLFGLQEALAMFEEEGLEQVFARHERLAEATRRAVGAWGLEIVCRDPELHSATITAILLPEGHDADAFRSVALERFNISLGAGLGKLAKRAFRIGHLGDLNALMLLGALAGIEMAFRVAGVPARKGGVAAAMDYLAEAN